MALRYIVASTALLIPLSQASVPRACSSSSTPISSYPVYTPSSTPSSTSVPPASTTTPASSADPSLDPSCAPGGNFDLSPWSLQLPSGSDGDPDTVSNDDLEGCTGYEDEYFSTDPSTGLLVMTVPGSPDSSGCVTTSGSSHCRTELREVDPDTGSNAAWDPSTSTNTLTVSLAVIAADDGSHGTAIGQVFGSDAGKPIAEMYYSADGDIVVGVNRTADGGSQEITDLGNVPLGTKFTYQLSYANDVLQVTINDETTTLDTYEWDSPDSYFKTGNYNQGDVPSEVHFYSIEIAH